MTLHLCTANYPANAVVHNPFVSYTSLFYYIMLKLELFPMSLFFYSFFFIFNQWELNNHHATWVNILQHSKLYFNKTDSTALSGGETRAPASLKVAFSLSKQRVSIEPAKSESQKACDLTMYCQTPMYHIFSFTHLSSKQEYREAGQVTSWLGSKVRLYGAQKQSLCATNTSAIKSAALLDLLLIALRSDCHKVM